MGCGRKKVASLYLVATSVVLVRLCLLCFIFVLPVASPPGGHDLAAYCYHVASGSGFFVFPSLVFPCYSNYFRGIRSPQRFFLFFSFLSFLSLFDFILRLSFYHSFNVPGFMACVCCACRTQ